MNKSILNYGKFIAIFLTGAILVSSCKKDKMPSIDPGPSSTLGIYVVCEGAFSVVTGSSNSSITYYDVAKGTSDKAYFKNQNGIDLGSNASDLKQYGSKMYCVISGTKQVNKDSYIEVINIATGKSIKRISFSNDSVGFMPRYIAFYKNKAYVSGYDGYISKIDTANLTIESRISVGGALEGLAIVNGKLYVTNSSHPDYPNSNNSSVSVVDLNTFMKIKDIPVGFNPIKIAATSSGDLFVLTKGNYGAIKPSLDKVSSITDTKVSTNEISLNNLNITGNKGFVIGDYNDAFLKLINIGTGEPTADFITDGTTVTTPYGITVNTFNNDVFVADANNYGPEGKVLGFGADGKWKFEFTTDSSPQSAVFNYSYK